MKTSRTKSFWTSWLRCFVRGLHALVAMMISGFVAQVVVWAFIGFISAIFGGFDGPLAEIVVPVVCFCFIGLPLFGFLFSGAYSPTEPDEITNQAKQSSESNDE